jgi:hypothetical protein
MSSDEFKTTISQNIAHAEELAAVFLEFHERIDALVGEHVKTVGLRSAVMREVEAVLNELVVRLTLKLS